MLFIIFLLCCINCSATSTLPDGENEILSFLTPLPQEILAIYERERDNIIYLIQNELGSKKSFTLTLGNYQELEMGMQNLLCKLSIKDLLKAIIRDNSDYVLVISLSVHPLIKLNDKLYFLGETLFPLSAMSHSSSSEIFNNFRRLIFKALLKTPPLSQSDGKELLSIIQLLWYNKLEPLGKKLLSKVELKCEQKLTKERFRFIDYFLNNDPKVRIIREYTTLRQDILEERGGSKFNYSVILFPSNLHFSFLAQQLKFRLKTLSSSEFLNDLEWLASQDQSFLSYFFHFLRSVKAKWGTLSIQHLARSTVEDILACGKISARSLIILEEENLFIFSKRTYTHEEQAEAVKLADIILKKLA